METLDAAGQVAATSNTEVSLVSRHEMGIRAVGSALRRARGRLSQQAAAERWNVPLATMAALEQGVVRDYQAQTLAQFDEMLGTSTLDLYERPDDTPAAPNDIGELMQAFSSEISERIATALRTSFGSPPSDFEFRELVELWSRTPPRLQMVGLYCWREILDFIASGGTTPGNGTSGHA